MGPDEKVYFQRPRLGFSPARTGRPRLQNKPPTNDRTLYEDRLSGVCSFVWGSHHGIAMGSCDARTTPCDARTIPCSDARMTTGWLPDHGYRMATGWLSGPEILVLPVQKSRTSVPPTISARHRRTEIVGGTDSTQNQKPFQEVLGHPAFLVVVLAGLPCTITFHVIGPEWWLPVRVVCLSICFTLRNLDLAYFGRNGQIISSPGQIYADLFHTVRSSCFKHDSP